MERVCFVGRAREARLAEYRERHERVWPQMLAAEVNERWQARMAPFFAELNGRSPDQGFQRSGEIFHLD